MLHHTDCFVEIENSLHPWDKFYLIMVYKPLNVYCFSQFTCILLRIVAYVVISDTSLLFCFLFCGIFGFGIKTMVSSWNEFGSVLPLKFME